MLRVNTKVKMLPISMWTKDVYVINEDQLLELGDILFKHFGITEVKIESREEIDSLEEVRHRGHEFTGFIDLRGYNG